MVECESMRELWDAPCRRPPPCLGDSAWCLDVSVYVWWTKRSHWIILVNDGSWWTFVYTDGPLWTSTYQHGLLYIMLGYYGSWCFIPLWTLTDHDIPWWTNINWIMLAQDESFWTILDNYGSWWTTINFRESCWNMIDQYGAWWAILQQLVLWQSAKLHIYHNTQIMRVIFFQQRVTYSEINIYPNGYINICIYII